VALVQCPECNAEVSSVAVACPHCGYPMNRPQGAADAVVAPSSSNIGSGVVPSQRQLSFGLSGTVAAFWWVTAVVFGISSVMFVVTWTDWSSYMIADGRFVDLLESDQDAFSANGLAYFAAFVAGILFIVWLYQAYRSAESRGATGRRWGPGWTIGGWFIPLANLVIPKLVVNEVDRMSNPEAGVAPIEARWKMLPRMTSSDLWWVLLVGGVLTSWIGSWLYNSTPDFDTSATGNAYVLFAISQGVLAVAAVMCGMVALAIGRRLRR